MNPSVLVVEDDPTLNRLLVKELRKAGYELDSASSWQEARERIAVQVKAVAVAWTVEYVEASDIDACGMTASLALAFRRAIRRIEEAGVRPDVVLLDGNPMRLDEREVNPRQ